jgi:hypothetical protein
VTACSKREEPTTAAPAGSYSGVVDVLSCEKVAGWVWIVRQTGPLKVDIIEAGKIVGTATADIFRQDLKDAGIGDGVHVGKCRRLVVGCLRKGVKRGQHGGCPAESAAGWAAAYDFRPVCQRSGPIDWFPESIDLHKPQFSDRG